MRLIAVLGIAGIAAVFVGLVVVVLLAWMFVPVLLPGQRLVATLDGGATRSFGRPYAFLTPPDPAAGAPGSLELNAYQFVEPGSEEYLVIEVPAPRAGGTWCFGEKRSESAYGFYSVRDIRTDHATQYNSDGVRSCAIALTRFDRTLNLVEGTFEFDARGTRGDTNPGGLHVRRGSFRVFFRDVSADRGNRLD